MELNELKQLFFIKKNKWRIIKRLVKKKTIIKGKRLKNGSKKGLVKFERSFKKMALNGLNTNKIHTILLE